ncbi:MAG TPA: DUF6391 domain-containing protein [Dehalococcoidia bacterium]|nr:DUF6391 domain-containing protein [Dehalococcoidia bacterium]
MLKRLIKAVRRNHALEHATIAILLQRLGRPTRVVGRAGADGFCIYADIPSDKIYESAREGLARLQAGETGLAVSPLCGTNIAVAGLLAGLASTLALGSGGRRQRLPQVLAAAMLAVTLAQPLGRLAQRHLTTSADLEGMEIVGVERLGRLPHLHKVRTRG